MAEAVLAAAAPAPPDEPTPLPRPSWSRWTFWLAALSFALLALRLALVNQSTGSFDSVQNLVVARNIVEGRGFSNGAVTQHTRVEALPGPELVRPPGAPYVGALAFALLGVGTHAGVVVSALMVLLTALALRAAVRALGGGWLGDASGALVLFAHGDFELISFWNNGMLTALTAGALYLATLARRERVRGLPLAAACALIAAVGFLVKPTFVLGIVPFSALLLGFDGRSSRRERLTRGLLFLGLLGLLTAPFWVRNLLLTGNPLPLAAPRLNVRYGIPSTWLAVAAVSYDGGMSYRDLAAQIGWGGIARAELELLWQMLRAIWRLGPTLILGALLAIPFAWRRERKLAALTAVLMLAPLFECCYTHTEDRYLWPLLPCLLFLLALGAVAAAAHARAAARSASDPAARADSANRDAAGEARVAWIALVVAVPAAYVLAAPRTVKSWDEDFVQARQAPPAWTPAVAALPASARVLAWNAPAVAWYARRQAVIVPLGDAGHVAQAMTAYHPDYLLLEAGWFAPSVAQTAALLGDRLAVLSSGKAWALLKIEPVSVLRLPAAAPTAAPVPVAPAPKG